MYLQSQALIAALGCILGACWLQERVGPAWGAGIGLAVGIALAMAGRAAVVYVRGW
jgi:hypothetical protein